MDAVVRGANAEAGEVGAARAFRLAVALLVVGSFAVYWASSFALVARKGTTHFGGDPWLYTVLAKPNPFEPLGQIARSIRFHSMTVLVAATWMKLAAPLTAWLAPEQVLRGLFAAFGALGVFGAVSAFAALMPRREALLWGAVYAGSLGVWYFAGIEESKALTTALAALYTATYVRLRSDWTPGRAVRLTLILLAACLNEIVAIFLVAIPAVDALVQRGVDRRHDGWIALHALIGPLVLLVMELVGRLLLPPSTHPEGTSHFGMLLWYIQHNDYSLQNLYAFALRWLFFNIAAPAPEAITGARPDLWYGGDFEASLANYLHSPLTASLVAAVGAMLVAAFLPRYRGRMPARTGALLLGLAAYALVRMLFFLLFNPWECLLFASGATLSHLMLIAVPFAASRLPVKDGLLLVVALLIAAANARFIIG